MTGFVFQVTKFLKSHRLDSIVRLADVAACLDDSRQNRLFRFPALLAKQICKIKFDDQSIRVRLTNGLVAHRKRFAQSLLLLCILSLDRGDVCERVQRVTDNPHRCRRPAFSATVRTSGFPGMIDASASSIR